MTDPTAAAIVRFKTLAAARAAGFPRLTLDRMSVLPGERTWRLFIGLSGVRLVAEALEALKTIRR